MESIDIVTGQHVTINYEPATIIQRMTALLLDYIFMGIYLVILFFLSFYFLDKKIVEPDSFFFILLGILSLPAICYHVMFESLMGGQTPGKIIAKTRVTNTDGSTPGFAAYFLRWILLPIDSFIYGSIGLLTILFTKKHQRLGDLAAGTIVVKIMPSASKINLDNILQELPQSYIPTYKEVEQLTEGQIKFVSELLLNPENQSSVEESIDEIALKIKNKLHLESSLSNRRFLETIVEDYHYYTTLGL